MVAEQILKQVLPTGSRVTDVASVGGGCISDACRITYADEDGKLYRVFIKQNRVGFQNNFEAELDGLKAINRVGVLRVPQPIGVFTTTDHAFLAMQWIESGRRATNYFSRFGNQLASHHVATQTVDEQHGGARENFLGSSRQPNQPCESWPEFVAERRLRFQLSLLPRAFRKDSTLTRDVERIADRMGELLDGREPSVSLLHGDLWSGNYLCDEYGETVVIDPAVYHGCPEAEFGMIELFGSCPQEFYEGYFQINPFSDGWQRRVRIYVLYHLLNHLNLFGGGYADQCRRVAAEILRAD